MTTIKTAPERNRRRKGRWDQNSVVWDACSRIRYFKLYCCLLLTYPGCDLLVRGDASKEFEQRNHCKEDHVDVDVEGKEASDRSMQVCHEKGDDWEQE